MPVTGGIKFFDQSKADSRTGAFIGGASSGLPAAPFIIDRNKYTRWLSVGSNDTIMEFVIVEFPEQRTVSRLFLLDLNFKWLEILWWDGFAWVPFSGVTALNGQSLVVARYTNYTETSSYFEISPVTTDQIMIRAKETHIANQQKYLNSFVATNELGTFQGFPVIRDATKDKKLRKSILLNGRAFVVKSLEVMRFSIDFKNYPAPTPYSDDLDLVYDLFDRDDNFLIWLCGGRNGDPYFKYQLRGFRIEDLIEVQVTNIFKDSYKNNFYNGTVKLKLILEEAA